MTNTRNTNERTTVRRDERRYRLIAIDVDGTLLDPSHRLSQANRAALHRAHEAGLTICICTGRMLAETEAVLDDVGLDLDVGVFVFGSLVNDLETGRTISRTTIDRPVADRLVDHFQQQGYPVLALYDRSQTGVDYRVVPGKRNAETLERWLSISPAKMERLSAWRPCGHEPVRLGIVDDHEQAPQTLTELQAVFGEDVLKCNSIYAPNYGIHVVECFAPQVNKWYGIMQVAGPLGIEPGQVVAIGDDVNDLEMIRHAGLGIAMGNAIAPIKAAADWHAPGNDASGVAAAIDHILANGQA